MAFGGTRYDVSVNGLSENEVPRIETPRLVLRGWTDADVEAWADMNADPRVMEFFVEPTPRDRSREQAARMRSGLQRNGYGWFVLERKDRAGFAGVIALEDIAYEVPFAPRREIGWRLPYAMWHHGYATEAARAAMAFAFTTLGWGELIAMTARLNVRSMRVMERLGMTRDPGEDFPHPRVPAGHRLQPHVLYRISAPPRGE
ncbi:MAG: GNAT family N-acetyltransferase [Candidatus Baltobacteraceae bacterium]